MRVPQRAAEREGCMLISILVTLVIGFVYFYINLPAVNLHSAEFYAFVLVLCAVYCVCSLVVTGFKATGWKDYIKHLLMGRSVIIWESVRVPVGCICLDWPLSKSMHL